MFGLISGCNQDQSSEEYIKSGQEYLGKKEWKSAIIEFKNALQQSPDNATARALLGKTYLETQSSSAAIKELNRAIDLGFERSELLLPLGRAYRQAGENQKIIDEIKPDDNQSTVEKATIDAWRGISYLSLGNKEAARESLDQARNLAVARMHDRSGRRSSNHSPSSTATVRATSRAMARPPKPRLPR
jgi:tetratricopeptide (TPR) repeat protein